MVELSRGHSPSPSHYHSPRPNSARHHGSASSQPSDDAVVHDDADTSRRTDSNDVHGVTGTGSRSPQPSRRHGKLLRELLSTPQGAGTTTHASSDPTALRRRSPSGSPTRRASPSMGTVEGLYRSLNPRGAGVGLGDHEGDDNSVDGHTHGGDGGSAVGSHREDDASSAGASARAMEQLKALLADDNRIVGEDKGTWPPCLEWCACVGVRDQGVCCCACARPCYSNNHT